MCNYRPIFGQILIVAGLLAISSCNAGTADQQGQQTSTDRTADDAAAVMPGEGPGTFEIAGGNATATIPFEFYGMNLLIHGKMNGKKVKLLIDNGRLWDEVWFYDGEADSINLSYLDGAEAATVTGSGEGEGSDIFEGNPVDIDLGGIRFFDQPALISPHEAGWAGFFPGVVGQVSSMLFKHFVVTFDFDESVIILTRPEVFKHTGAGKAVPMKLAKNGAFSIPITIGMPDSKELELRPDIDLGGIYPLHLVENDALGIRRPEDAVKEHLGYGASGEITGYKGHVPSVRIDSYTMSDVVTVFVEEGSNTNPDIVKSGTIGLPLMKRFNITFDYFNMVMYFEPNGSFEGSLE